MSDTQHTANSRPNTSVTGTLEVVKRAALDGAADAREAAARTWAATGRFLSRFVYTTCYTISYGVVFPTVLLARSIPKDNPIVHGLVDGAHAAVDMVEEMKKRKLEAPSSEPVPAIGHS